MSKLGIVNEIHRNVLKTFPRRRVVVKGLHDLVQIDLVDMVKYARVNKGYQYILTGINCFSKVGYGIPVLNKSGPQVTAAFEKMLKIMKVPPRHLCSDEGKEFFNRSFQKLVQQHGINHYHTYSPLKSSVVERFNRSLRKLMHTQFSYQGNYIWYDKLDSILNVYNSRIHRTIKMRPKDVSIRHEKKLLRTVYKIPKPSNKSKFHIGDVVRVSKHKTLFEKGYTPNWSTELYTIAEILPTTPEVYLLKDYNGERILGSFYKQELAKTAYPDTYLVEKILKRDKAKKRVYIKWLGFLKPTWESEYNISQ